jgi:hypothetical protein
VSIDYVFQEKFQDNFRLVDTSCTSTNALGYADLNCNILQQFIDLDDISNLNQLNHQLNVDIKYATLILQKPGSVNASHYDKFWPLNDIPTNKIKVRINVFLSKWYFGQLVECSNKTISRWSIGEATCWDSTIEHFAINFSKYDKLTLQLSGLYND